MRCAVQAFLTGEILSLRAGFDMKRPEVLKGSAEFSRRRHEMGPRPEQWGILVAVGGDKRTRADKRSWYVCLPERNYSI